MLARKDLQRSLRTTVSVVAALCLFSACASTSTDSETPPAAGDAPTDASLLLDESTKQVGATDVSDAGAFADLESNKEKTSATIESGKDATTDDGAPFYNTLGGETVRRVAFTLYSDKSFAKQLLEKNPELKGVKKLSAEQKVFFDIESSKPEPTYLTKDLLDRYADQLAGKVDAAGVEKGIAKTTVTVSPGETLQQVSKRLYGTSRYWTEIYLVNHDKIKNYDKVRAGMTLSVFNRPNTGVAAAEPSAPKFVGKVEEPKVQEEVAESRPAPAVSPAAAIVVPTQPEPESIQPAPQAMASPTPADPIPETSTPVVAKAPEPVAPPPVELAKPVPVAVATAEVSSSNGNLRKITYALLVLALGGAAFYFTRGSKRSKVDMLDITAAQEGGSRPKLTPVDSQKTNIS